MPSLNFSSSCPFWRLCKPLEKPIFLEKFSCLKPARSQEASKSPARGKQEDSKRPARGQQEDSKRPGRGQQEASKRLARGQQEASKRPARGQQEAPNEGDFTKHRNIRKTSIFMTGIHWFCEPFEKSSWGILKPARNLEASKRL